MQNPSIKRHLKQDIFFPSMKNVTRVIIRKEHSIIHHLLKVEERGSFPPQVIEGGSVLPLRLRELTEINFNSSLIDKNVVLVTVFI